MSVSTNSTITSEFELTLQEQWAIHRAFLDYVEVSTRDDTELPEPTVEIAILEKLEAGNFEFTPFELDRIYHECLVHARSDVAPEMDYEPACSVVEKIDRQCDVAISH